MKNKEIKIPKEKISSFLQKRMELLKKKYGPKSSEYLGIAKQFKFDEKENEADFTKEKLRHYEAELLKDPESGTILKGIERLYRRVALIDISTVCTTRCRFCLRALYPQFQLTRQNIKEAIRYLGISQNKADLREVLITGGDPFLFPELLSFCLDLIVKHAPNIKIARIGSRLPIHDPSLVNKKLLCALKKRNGLRIEMGTQINHPIEICEESKRAYQSLQNIGIKIYNQQVMLKGVNDNLDTLVQLYDKLRAMDIEAHYMFHCVPRAGISHLRTSIEEDLELIKELTMSGKISGRCKPKYTLMTDIGKITLYEGIILDKKEDMILLQTKYSKNERLEWNPSWKIPDSAMVDQNGHLRVWYRDGKIHNEGWPSTYYFNANNNK